MTNPSLHSEKNRNLGIGIGLRSPHYSALLESRTSLDWFEATSENYMGIGGDGAGNSLKVLEKIRGFRPVVLHGVSLSVGSVDPLDRDYLGRLKKLTAIIEPEWISDHVCWTGVEGENLHDLMPLPYTEEALAHLVSRVGEVQETLGRRIFLENVSSYLTYSHSTLAEWEFLTELSNRSDCGLLLDLNNIYVSAINHHFDPLDFIRGVPGHRVGQIHLAGHSEDAKMLIDTHDHPICDPVWNLYRHAIQLWGPTPTLVEWDASIPPLPILIAEAEKARAIHG